MIILYVNKQIAHAQQKLVGELIEKELTNYLTKHKQIKQ